MKTCALTTGNDSNDKKDLQTKKEGKKSLSFIKTFVYCNPYLVKYFTLFGL